MDEKTSLRVPNSCSDNRKSKIQNRKWLVGLFAIIVTLTVCGARADAQQAGKVFRIGFLDTSTASGSAVLVEAFRQELRKLGWIERKNISFEYRFAEQKQERLPELAAELVRLKVDLIVVASTLPTPLAAKRRNYHHTNRDGDRRGSRGFRVGCQSGAAGRQYHRELAGLSTRAKYQTARDTQGRNPHSSHELDCLRRGRGWKPTIGQDLQLKELRACGSWR